MPKISQRDALEILSKKRLLELGRGFELEVGARSAKPELVDALAHSRRASYEKLLGTLKQAELRSSCEAAGLPKTGRKSDFVLKHRSTKARHVLPTEHESLLNNVAVHLVPKTARPVGERISLTFRRMSFGPAGARQRAAS